MENTQSFGSFGCHAARGDVNDIIKQDKISEILDLALKVSGAALVTLGIITAVTSLSAVWLIGAIAAFVGIAAFSYTNDFINYANICKTAGIVMNFDEEKAFQPSSKTSKVEAIPCEHGADTEMWREDLINAAEHNIVISGNYCGGKSFIRFLDCIEKRINEKPDLQVVVISSPKFLSGDSDKKWKELAKKYPNNFSLVVSPDVWHVSPGLKKTTNHTKCMVVDYGKYFILGGSGIKDNFTETGRDDLPKGQYEAEQKKAFTATGSDGDDDGWLGKFIPGNFRDMDFVFGPQGNNFESGKDVFRQMLLLSYRWEKYNQMLKRDYTNANLDVAELGAFSGNPSNFSSDDSLTVRMLKKPIPPASEIKTKVERFSSSEKKAGGVEFKLFASGPEQSRSPFAKALKQQIEEAKESIVISHMYFQPSAEIYDALVAAGRRGVKITINTCGEYKDCPNSHMVFGPRNKYNYQCLYQDLGEEFQGNLKVYEYQQKKKGLHKKVIVIDEETILAGSSNLGYKSLVTTSDHELNFMTKSREFAEETMKVIQQDIERSKLIDPSEGMSFSEIQRAFLHRLWAPLIG